MKILAKIFPRSANKVACQEYGAALYQKAKLVPPPEGELLALIVTGAALILEQLVDPTDKKRWIVWQELAPLSTTVISELHFATIWTLVALFISQERESEEDLIVACSSLVGELEMGSEFQKRIWDGFADGALPSVATALHSRYREILCSRDGVDGGFIMLILELTAAYSTISRAYNEE